MPRISLHKEKLADYVRNIMQGLSLEQAGLRTNLAPETIRKMKIGKVPEPYTLQLFAEGFKDRGADLHELMVICGYEQPSDIAERVKLAVADRFTPETVDILVRYVRELEEAERKKGVTETQQ